jgi:hypothetical protein
MSNNGVYCSDMMSGGVACRPKLDALDADNQLMREELAAESKQM